MSDEPKQAANTIPYERFQTVNEQRKEAEQTIASLKAQLADVQKQAGAADALFSQVETLNKTLESERQTWNQERTLMGAGLLDKEARDLALWSYSRIEGDDKPPLGDWLDGMRAEGAEVPAYLSPYLKGKADAKQAAPMPDTNRGAMPTTIENGGYQKDSIAAMSVEEYKAHREKIRARWMK